MAVWDKSQGFAFVYIKDIRLFIKMALQKPIKVESEGGKK